MLKEARERAGLSQERLAELINCSRSSLSKYENGQAKLPFDVSLWWAIHCNAPEVANLTCNELCPLGQAFSYRLLDEVDRSIPSVILVGLEELNEAIEALGKFGKLMRNKKHVSELTVTEVIEAESLQQQFLHDIARFVEEAKAAMFLMGFDIQNAIIENDKKAIKKGYIKKKPAMLAQATASFLSLNNN